MKSAPGAIRTHDRQIRSLVLYPAELQAHNKDKVPASSDPVKAQTRPRDPLICYDVCLRFTAAANFSIDPCVSDMGSSTRIAPGNQNGSPYFAAIREP